ncbi:transmembrane protein 144 isoform X2 [Aplysia californica]|uniref:Transmembrane protein 144 isoform X2 n=1 Tax=Aplysia californica TaxID=6500 RepID=A0ABM1VXU9_APLCA|nr:transmembrane protein 144 isoform X2 [Aplysia californica]
MEWINVVNTTVAPHNTTTPLPQSHSYPDYVGYICSLIAVLMYGSNFVPVKKFVTGDGMFFQYVLCSGIFLVGIVVQLVQNSTFYPLVMLGGFIWATGNLCVVPVFKTIGMGLGMSIWGTFALVAGWASGKFGWFGNKDDVISNPAMNYGGVGLAFGSILLYVMVKNEVSGSTEMEIIVTEEETSPLISGPNDAKKSGNGNGNDEDDEQDDRMWIEDLSPMLKRIIGTGLSIFSGFMYGINFTPAIHVQDNVQGASKNGLDYVFAHFCGIYMSSSIYFYIYCAVKKNKPKVYPKVILPGIVSGIMWGIATASWYIANATLSESVTFPIISTAPAAIASLFWGVVVFHEIKGKRNILILIAAFCIMSGGAVLAGLSK